MKEKILAILADINEDVMDDVDGDLFETEILDSFEIVKLVMKLEEVFDITIGIEMVTAENFRTVDGIVQLVQEITEG